MQEVGWREELGWRDFWFQSSPSQRDGRNRPGESHASAGALIAWSISDQLGRATSFPGAVPP